MSLDWIVECQRTLLTTILTIDYHCSGTANDTRGTAFVVYEDIFDAKTACDHLQGFNILGRYLIVLYYQLNKVTKKANLQKREAELQELKRFVVI